MYKKASAGISLICFLIIIIWLLQAAFRPAVLPLGAHMPALEYHSSKGVKHLAPDSSYSTIVVHFHSLCKYCKYQLNLFNENLNSFNDVKMIILTTEKNFLRSEKTKMWPELEIAQNVMWGEVDPDQFENRFGSRAVPYVFIFDQFGRLLSKIRGEAKLDKILKELNKTGGPERRVSGHN